MADSIEGLTLHFCIARAQWILQRAGMESLLSVEEARILFFRNVPLTDKTVHYFEEDMIPLSRDVRFK